MNEFNEPHKNFKPERRATTPFHKAQRVWNERVGGETIRARNWRIFALGTLGITTIAISGLIFQSTKSKVEPFYVRINSDGYTQTFRPENTQATPKLNEIKYFLAQFVTNIRSVPMDIVVAKQNFTVAYGYLTQQAGTLLQQYYNKDGNPSMLLGKQTVTVAVKSILPQSKDTYQIHWQEDIYDLEGKQIDSYKMTGLFTILIKTPDNEKQLFMNPLGIYIKNFTWAKDL